MLRSRVACREFGEVKIQYLQQEVAQSTGGRGLVGEQNIEIKQGSKNKNDFSSSRIKIQARQSRVLETPLTLTGNN